jgi:hypothetical protein
MKTGEILKCPHCGKEEDSPVEDFVVQGPLARIGPTSRVEDQCGWCDGAFAVERVNQDTYLVEKA